MKKLTGILSVLLMVLFFSFSPVFAAQATEAKPAAAPAPKEAEAMEDIERPEKEAPVDKEREAMLKEGNYYTFKLPENVTITEAFSVPLTDKEGKSYGKAYVGVDNVVIIALTQEAAKEPAVTERLAAAGAEPAEVQSLGASNVPRGSVVFKKQDGNGNGLAGARFEILKTDSNNRTVAAVTSGEDGGVRCDGLEPGTYRVVETQAARGYLLNTESLDFAISEAGQTVDLGAHRGYQGRLEILKMDEAREPLAGAAFKILDANGYTLQKDLITGEDGRILVSNLPPGRYQVMETEAPEGYHLDATPVDIEIASEARGEPAAIEVKAVNAHRSSKVQYSTNGATPNADTGVDVLDTAMGGSDFFGLGLAMAAAVIAAAMIIRRKSKMK